MRSSLSFTIESFLLFEASLLQYAQFVAASASITPSNLSSSISSSTSCSGCTISAPQTLLSYTHPVTEVTATSSVTIIPYVTVYEDGKNITNYSTYTKYSSGASDQGLHTDAPPLTWETLGTTLTYPTTYLAYPSIFAGANTKSDTTCQASLTSVSLSPSELQHLIYPLSSGVDGTQITKSAQAYLDSLPTITSLVKPNNPSQCSHGLGIFALLTTAPAATASPVEPVIHTSVKLLTSQGQAVIIKGTGTAEAITQGSGSNNANPPPTQPASTGGNSGGGGGGGNNNPPPKPTPILNLGGSTITAGPGGAFNIGGYTLTPGGPAQVVDGTTVSIAAGGSVAIVNGQTSSLGSITPSSSGPVQATGAAHPGPVPGITVKLWVSGFAIGFLGIIFGICL